jgi:putative transcriptional regulator
MKNHVKVFRVMAGLNQAQLAERLNVSRQTIVNIERGKHEPSIGLVLRMAQVLECSMTDLFSI